MYGAIIGDMFSTTYDPDQHKTVRDILYDKKLRFSNDTVMNLVIANALVELDKNAGENEIKSALEESMRDWCITDGVWGIKFPDENYRIPAWISSIAWIYSSDFGRTQEVAYKIAKIICNSSEKEHFIAAEMLAWAIFSARVGFDQEGIKCYINKEFNHLENYKGYYVAAPREEYINEYESEAVENVKRAVDIFCESRSFEDAIQRSIIADTYNEKFLACMAGSIAEAYYGIPANIKEHCNKILFEAAFDVLDRVDYVFRRNSQYGNGSYEGISGNERIEHYITLYQAEQSEKNINNVKRAIYHRLQENGYLNTVLKSKEHENDDDPLEYETINIEDGENFITAYTSDGESFDEKNDEPVHGIFEIEIKELFEEIANGNEYNGIIFNRYDKTFTLTKNEIKELLSLPKSESELGVIIESVTALKVEAIVNFTDEAFNGIDSKIDLEIDELTNKKLRKMLKKYGSYQNGKTEITKGHGLYAEYVIHAVVDNKLDNLAVSIANCLDVARENQLHQIAIPVTCSERQNQSRRLDILKTVFLIENMAVRTWFKENENYEMTVTLAVDYEDQKIFKVNQINIDNGDSSNKDLKKYNEFIISFDGSIDTEEENMTVNKEKSEAYKKLVLDMQKKYSQYDLDFSKGAAISTSEGAKQKAREFSQKFNSKNEFWKALKDLGFKWRAEDSSDENIQNMWAINALAVAIDRGFNPNDKVHLWKLCIDGICHEINMYTYWQGLGYAERTPKIKYLLVAQDWGNLNLGQDFIDKIKKCNAGDRNTLYYYEKPTGIGTDPNLFDLFDILGYDLSKRYDELFFTNFCLGYRSGNGVGGMTKELMMKDTEEFRRLCEILEPENILCLGKLTAECVYKTLKNIELKDTYGDAKDYNEYLDNNPQMVLAYGEGNKILSTVYPLAHCGYMGTMNRPLEKQKQDWKNIADEKRIDIAIENFCNTNKDEDKNRVLDEIFSRVQMEGSFIIPLQDFGDGNFFDDVIPIFKNIKSVFLSSKHDGKTFLAAFTTLFEFAKFNESSGGRYYFKYVPMGKLLQDCLRNGDGIEGIILNPAGENQFRLTREMVKDLWNK